RAALHAAYEAALAAKLGVSVESLQAAIEANKPERPAQPSAEEQRARVAAHLERMVASGTVTQEQADQILADIDAGKPVFEVLRQLMPQLGEGRGERGPGDRGPGKGRGPSAQGQQQGNGARGFSGGFQGQRA
ncbi:MAG: hypothetical protein AB7G21_14525, partial [Dehalococcoidia bacterium]